MLNKNISEELRVGEQETMEPLIRNVIRKFFSKDKSTERYPKNWKGYRYDVVAWLDYTPINHHSCVTERNLKMSVGQGANIHPHHYEVFLDCKNYDGENYKVSLYLEVALPLDVVEGILKEMKDFMKIVLLPTMEV